MTKEEALKLATEYAPIFAQKVSNEWKVADQIAPIDYAGTLIKVADNPDILDTLGDQTIIPAHIYFSVCETTTHYFLIYAVYHILDWWKREKPGDLYNIIRERLDEHIHDMEGAMLVVTKYPDGLVDGLITVAHNNFYLYTEPQVPLDEPGKYEAAFENSLKIVKFNETVDGNIWIDKQSKRVKLYIESKGHGMRGDWNHWGSGDEIWYYKPEREKSKPGTIDKSEKKNTQVQTYKLVDIFQKDGLWDHRRKPSVFLQNKDGKWGFVYRDKHDKNKLKGGAANPPWSWNDHNDTSPIGEVATDPAQFIIRYAQGWGPVSTHYIYNPYLSI